jgi:hypothetical protein
MPKQFNSQSEFGCSLAISFRTPVTWAKRMTGLYNPDSYKQKAVRLLAALDFHAFAHYTFLVMPAFEM